MSLSYTRSPGWLRGVQIGLGILVIALSIFALTFPAYMFLSVIVILSIILFFVGIEKIITGMILHSKSRWTTVGLGILVLIFAGLAISFLVATAFIVIIFIGIALLFSGIARVLEGMLGHHSLWASAFLISVGIGDNHFDCSLGIPCVRRRSWRSSHSHRTFDNRHPDGRIWDSWSEVKESGQ